MFKVTILYPAKPGGRFDFEYYLNRHIPMTRERLGPILRGLEIERGLNGGPPESQPHFVVICHLYVDSPEAFYEAWPPHAEALQGDIPRYTDIEPMIQVSQVEVSE